MSDFLYFIEGKQSLEDGLLSALGIADMFPGKSPSYRSTSGSNPGPGSKPGIVIGYDSADRFFGYDPSTQQWAQCSGYWIGCDTSSKPCPTDLIRNEHVKGRPLKLSDGNQWYIPILRWGKGNGTDLPLTVCKNPSTGQYECDVAYPFSALWNKGVDIFQKMIGVGEGLTLEFDDQYQFCADMLRFNYRINDGGIYLLKLFTNDLIWEVMKIAVDFDVFMKYAKETIEATDKKKDASG